MAKLSVDQMLMKASSHARKDEVTEAQKLYQAVLVDFPKNIRAQQGLATLNKLKQNSPQEVVAQLVNLYNQGEFSAVVEQAQAFTEQYPEVFAVWNILGVSAAQIEMLDLAITAFQKVISLKPDFANAYFNMGVALNDQGKMEEAIKAYNKAISLKPNYADAYSNLGNALKDQGKLNEAVEAYNKALSLKPDFTEAYNNLGNALKDQGKLDEAIEAYNKAILLKPNYANAYNNMGNALKGQDKLDKAVEAFKKAILLKPNYANAYNNMGNALKDQGELNEAIEAFKKTLLLKPNYANAYNNMGNALKGQGKLDEAIEAYNKSISLKPDYAQAYNNLGNALNDQGKLDKAVEAFKKVIVLKPNYSEVYFNMANALKDQGKLDKAIEAYNKSISLKPDFVDAHNNLGYTLQEKGRLDEAEASYNNAIALQPDYNMAYSNKNFFLNHSSLWSPLFIFQQHLEFEKQFGGLEVRTPLSFPVKKQPGDKLRIGYVSGDLNKHSVAYFFEPLLQHHNTNAIETFCYYNNKKIDEITDRLITTSNNWRSIFGVSDTDVVNLIKNDKIDILVDLSGHTGKNRLLVFAQKPAPIQVTWLGYPNTTGLSAIDYRLTDIIADPIGEADDFHSETLLRLPNGFQCYKGDQTVIADVNLPQKSNGYITFGSFNNFSKLTPEVIQIWSKILHAIPKSRLILKNSQFNHDTTRYIKLFNKEGISEDQIKLYGKLPNQDDHLKLYNAIDIGLDPFPFNGATTTCEALWMGVPVITLLGDRHVGRVGASILTNVELTDFIAQDIDDYRELAIKMAGNIEYLEKTRQGLRERMESSPFCNGKSFACDIENAYQDMWNKYIN